MEGVWVLLMGPLPRSVLSRRQGCLYAQITSARSAWLCEATHTTSRARPLRARLRSVATVFLPVPPVDGAFSSLPLFKPNNIA